MKRINPASAAKHTLTHSQIFSALDLIDNALGDFENTLRLFSTLIDHDIEQHDPSLIITVERHLRRDFMAVRSAEAKARDSLLRTGGVR